MIVFNPDGTASVLGDTSVGPYDGIEDTLVGVQNNTGLTVSGVEVTSSLSIFGFDRDGICGGCGPTGYEGPNTSFRIINSSDGIVSFTGGLAPGASAYFALEEAATAAQIVIPTKLEVSSVDLDGMDVKRDRKGLDPQTITDYSACGTGDAVEWKDCTPGVPDGTPEKSWPVVYKKGSKVTVTEARFVVENHAQFVDATTVTGTTSLPGGQVLTFTGSGTQAGPGADLVVRNMTSDNPLPNTVTHLNDMVITWTIKAGTVTFPAGRSNHPVYVVFDTPKTPLDETLVDITTRAADGKSTDADVVNATYGAFATRDLHRRDLDPASGAINLNAGDPATLLQYWTPWTFPGGVTGTYFGGFPFCDPYQTEGILKFLIGRCGGWAQLFADTLGTEGIGAKPKGVDDPALGPGFPAFPAAPAGCTGGIYGGQGMMLIKNWTFIGPPTGTGNYPFLTDVVVDTDSLGTRVEFNDAAGLGGQGEAVVPNPPGWFGYGDHAIVVLNSDAGVTKKIYDPSYGTSPGSPPGPFPSIGAWAQASLDGFACMDAKVTAGGKTTITVRGHKGIRTPTTTKVAATPATATFGSAVTFKATVTPNFPSTYVATGTVRFFLDGQAAPVATVSLSSGSASFTTSGLSVGIHSVVATYDGDANFTTSTSDPASVTVGAAKTTSGPVNGSVIVPTGSTVLLVNATVTGSVVVQTGGALDLENSTIGGSLTVSGPSALRVCSVSLTGTVTVTAATGFVLLGDTGDDACGTNTIAGALNLRNNTHGVEAIGNHVTGTVTIAANSGVGAFPEDSAPEISGNGP